MYNCEKCNKTSKAGEPAFKLVTETREVNYPFREEANRRDSSVYMPYGTDDPGGKGVETVKELTVCENCSKVE